MPKITVFFLFIFINAIGIAQGNKSTLSGYLTDSKNGEAIIGAKIVITQLNLAAVTNTYGFYSLTVPSGKYTVEFRTIMYPIDE